MTRSGTNTDVQPAEEYTWDASDSYDELQDRKDLPPMPLPKIACPQELVLVRHGQSSWNQAKRIQGSSNISVLTDKGLRQAQVAHDKLTGRDFAALYSSPLKRSAKTAEIIWAGRGGSATFLPSLREVDLYSFQGLVKAEGKARFGEQYQAWQMSPHTFAIDGHAPVRELWYRASLALQTILTSKPPAVGAVAEVAAATLVVAHNAVNQALLCVALGLPPSRFRALVQNNAATSALLFQPAHSGGSSGGASDTHATLLHLNESPDVVVEAAEGGTPSGCVRSLLLTAGDLSSSDMGATATALRGFQVDRLLCDDEPAAQALAAAVAQSIGAKWGPQPQVWQPLRSGGDALLEASPEAQQHLCATYAQLCSQLVRSDDEAGATVLIVTSAERGSALAHGFLGLAHSGRWAVALQPGGITIADSPWDDHRLTSLQGTTHCMNNRSHLLSVQS